MKDLNAIVDRIIASNKPAGVLATLVTVAGSSYRRPGARLLLASDGTRIGSISGGCLEEDIVARGQRVADTGRAELVTYDTTSENDLVWGVGLGCHGVVSVLLEKIPARPAWADELTRNIGSHRPTPLVTVWRAANPAALGTHLESEHPTLSVGDSIFAEIVQPPLRLVIFGAGNDAQPLVRLATGLGWQVTVADARSAFATAQRFPAADAIVVGAADGLVAQISPNTDSVAVVMTHHYVYDVPILRDLLPRQLSYVGLLGPKKRAARIVADLEAQGHLITPEQLSRLHAPVGLDIGAEGPEEVALSIIAEIRASLAGRNARPLRDRIHPIHD